MSNYQWPLLIGSFCIAYTPLLFIFSLLIYPKAQLVIIVTSFAFAYILSATCSSIMYTIFKAIFQFDNNNNNNDSNNAVVNSVYTTISSDGILAAIIPSILFQFIFRCLFTSLYHKVERIIQISIQKQMEQERESHNNDQQQMNQTSNNHGNGNDTVDTVIAGSNHSSSSNVPNDTQQQNQSILISETAKLKLALNDGTASIAAAVGFGGMHSIVLYGTLLSSETIHNTTGILYQNSCPNIPSLIVSAIITNLFIILQIFWMLFTFFGMRRRLLFSRNNNNNNTIIENEGIMMNDDNNHRSNHHRRNSNKSSGKWFGNTRTGGNYALLSILITHTAASCITLYNRKQNGCLIVLPSLTIITIFTAYLFYIGCGRIYMPSSINNSSTTTNNTINTQQQQQSVVSDYQPHSD